ncbi:hypothetical protein D9M71_681320 [compost metagenome]
MQAAGIQAEYLDVLVQFPGHVHQHHIFGAAEGDPQFVTEMLEGEFEDVLGGLAGIARRQFGDVEGLAHQAGFLIGSGAGRALWRAS